AVVDRDDAAAIDAPGNVVLLLARGDAAVALDAALGVAEKFHSGHDCLLSPFGCVHVQANLATWHSVVLVSCIIVTESKPYVVAVFTASPRTIGAAPSGYLSSRSLPCHQPAKWNGMKLVPGPTRSVTSALTLRCAPLGVFTHTQSQYLMPRAAASFGLISTKFSC